MFTISYILIADDNKKIAKILFEHIKKEDFQPVIVNDVPIYIMQ
jgi:DNA-binding response OmpR family regulator